MRAVQSSIALAIMLVVAACGDANGSTDPTTSTSGATTTASETTDAAPAGPAPDDADDGGESADGALAGSDLPAPEGAIEVEESAQRLVVADGVEPEVTMLDLATGETLAEFDVAGPSRVYAIGRFVMAVARDSDRVEVLDAATWDVPHGDHFHFYIGTPAVTDAGFDAAAPTHLVEHRGTMAVFNDAEGSVTVLEEGSDRDGAPPRIVDEIDSGGPHHGVAVPLPDRSQLITTTPPLDDGLPNGVEVVDLRTQVSVAEFYTCPGLHGEFVASDLVAFGCEDGVLVLSADGEQWSGSKVPRPDGALADDRTGTLAGSSTGDYLVGNLGPNALVAIDVASATPTIMALDLPIASFAYDERHHAVLALTTDGTVHRLDASAGETLQTISALDAFELAGGHGGTPRPSLMIAGNRAYLTAPAEGRVVELGIADELRVARDFAVGGAPASITVVG